MTDELYVSYFGFYSFRQQLSFSDQVGGAAKGWSSEVLWLRSFIFWVFYVSFQFPVC